MANFSPDTLQAARDAGYSDDQIYDHLSQTDPRFDTARQSGYKLDDVAAHLAAQSAPSLPTQVVQSGEVSPPEIQPSGYVGKGEFAPSAGAESAPLTSRENPQEQAAQQSPLANAASVATELAAGIPQMAAGVAKAGYEGLKFAALPQERAPILEKAITEGLQQGRQIAQDVQSPLGTKESFRGLANVGMMAVPALQELLFAKPTGITAPPVQSQGRPTTAPTLTETLGLSEKQPEVVQAANDALTELESKYAPPAAQPVPAATEATAVLGKQEPVAEPTAAGTGGDITVFRGESKGPSPAGQAHGIGTYYGLTPEDAQRFSRQGTVQQHSVTLENPAVVNSDAELSAIRTDAGVNPDPRMLLSKDEAARFTQYLQGTGHDSFVTNYGDATGGKQVVVFPESPPSRAAVPGASEPRRSVANLRAAPHVGEAPASTTGSGIQETGGAAPLSTETTTPEEVTQNASKIEEPTTPDGGLRTRSGVEELPTGNVESADARLRGDQGVQTPEARQGSEAGTQTAQTEVAPVSTKNAYTEQQRAIRGMPEAEQAAKRGFGKVWDEAAAESEKDPTIGQRLVAEINSKPRPISDVENAHLLRREIEAQREHSDAVDAVNTATNDSDLTAAKARLESARNDLQDVYDATKSAGTKGGQALAARKMLANEDYSLAKMEARRRAANDGKPLNEQQLSETSELHAKIADLQSKLDAHEVASTFDKEFKKLVDESRKEAKTSKAKGTRFTDFMDRKANEARARITERRGRLTTGFDPTSITDEAVIGASHIAKGLTKFADWSVEMAKEFGDQIRPFLKDLWERSKSFHDANASEYGDRALARYKTYLGKQTEQIKGKIEAGDFTKAQRQKTQLDKEAFEMRANLQKLKNQFERGVAKEAYQKKTPAQKFWDHFVGVERAMKLSGPEVFGKLGTAAAVREVLAPIESAGGYAASKVFPKFVKGTSYQADLGTVVRSELKAKAALFTEGMKDFWQNVKGQETGLDALGKQKIRPDFWYNRIGQMHAAIKAPVKRAEYTRSLEQRMAVALKNGEDINHPAVMTRLSNEAVMEANRAIFQNKTVVSGFFSMLERQSPVAGRVARFLFPVVKIPVNIFKELVNLHVGAPVGAARVGMAYWKGVETLPVAQREAIIRQLTKGSIGGAGLLWGYYNRDKVRNFFDHAPVWFQHTPMAMVLNEGSYLKGIEAGGQQAKESKKELAYMAKTDIPFMYSIKDIGDALDTHNSHALLGWINNMTQSTVVPQILTQTAKQMDKPGSFPSNIGERPTFRKPSNPIEAVKSGIPGLRQTVPEGGKKAENVSRKR